MFIIIITFKIIISRKSEDVVLAPVEPEADLLSIPDIIIPDIPKYIF